MPLFLDVHKLEDVALVDLELAHRRDLAVQADHDVSYLQYWLDEERGWAFCLCEAPSAQAAAEVHRRAHGLVADEIYEVQEGC